MLLAVDTLRTGRLMVVLGGCPAAWGGEWYGF